MLPECAAAAGHLASFIQPAPDASQLATFTARLADLLAARYDDHWHVDDPERGSGYRAIVRTGSGAAKIDPIVLEAAGDADPDDTAAALARGGGLRWTIWVDPGCVSIRVGDALDWASVTVVWGTLATPASTVYRPITAGASQVAQPPLSPSKRSRAIQIVDPSARRVSQPCLVAPPTPAPRGPFIGTNIIPPTPCAVAPDAGPLPSPTRASPLTTNDDPFLRPSSRAESVSSFGSIDSVDSSRGTSIFSHSAKSSASSEADVFARPAMPVAKRPIAGHRHTSSTASNASIASSISRPSSAAGSHTGDKVIDYSGGRVGVLGGNVMLGLPSNATRSSSIGSGNTVREDGGEHTGGETPIETASSSVNDDAPRRVRGQRSRSRARSANGVLIQPNFGGQHAAQLQQALMYSQQWAQQAY